MTGSERSDRKDTEILQDSVKPQERIKVY